MARMLNRTGGDPGASVDKGHRRNHLLDALTHAILWEAEGPVARQFTFVSDSAAPILGYPVRQWLSEPGFWERHIHPDERDEIVRRRREATERGEDHELEYRMVAVDGRIVWLLDSAYLAKDPAGRVERLRGLMIDITAHKRTERQLFVQYAATRILAEASTFGEAAPRILEAVCAGLDWDLGELWAAEPGQTVLTLKESLCVPGFQATLFQEDSKRRAFERGVGLPGRVWASGEPEWIDDLWQQASSPRAPFALEAGLRSAFAFPVRSRDRVRGVMVFLSQTRRERDEDLLRFCASLGSQIGLFIEWESVQEVEEELREKEARLRAIVTAAADGIIVIDERGVIQSLNPAAERLFGYSAQELAGQNVNLLMPNPYREEHDRYLAHYLTTGEGKIIGIGREVTGRRKDGSTFLMHLSVSEVALDGRRMFTGIVRDLTDRERAEQLLSLQKALLEATGEASIDGILVVSNEGQMIWFNHRFVDMWGIPAHVAASRSDEAALRSAFDKLVRPDEFSARVRYLYEHPDEESREEILLKDGRTFDRYSAPVRGADGPHYGRVWYFRDITDRKQVEERQRFLGEAGAVLAATLDFDAVVRGVTELVAGTMADWCAVDMLAEEGSIRRVALAHSDAAKAEMARRLENIPPDPVTLRHVMDALRCGHSILEAEVSEERLVEAAGGEEHLRIMRELGFKSEMIVPLSTRDRLLGVIRFVRAESGRRYTPDDLDLAEELARRAALAIDNARLYREAQEVQEQLRRANEAKDEFLGLVSHELRTPITTIYGGARVLRSRGEHLPEEDRAEILRDIERETERLYRLVEDMLVLARLELGQEVAVEPLLIQRLVEKVAKSFGQRNPSRPLELKVADLDPVLGEATYLEQVLRNLLSNAEKYSPAGAPITICATADSAEATVSVLDRGSGIAPDETESIFERFYRSKKSSEASTGLGLGMTVCKRLIEAQSGRIWARPRDGGGLEVSFAIPLYREEVPAPWEPNR